jgi:hypothetical protein
MNGRKEGGRVGRKEGEREGGKEGRKAGRKRMIKKKERPCGLQKFEEKF